MKLFLRFSPTKPMRLLMVLLLAAAAFNADVSAKPLVRCEVTYAGTTHIIDSIINNNPEVDAGGAYIAEASDIGGRFRFKTIMLGKNDALTTIKIYVFYEARRQPVLLQEVKYEAPFSLSKKPHDLTGMNYLYSPPLGRELQYGCALLDDNKND